MRQLSIRDLLFLAAVIALALGWWLDRRPVPARFQMSSAGDHVFVLDTATGKVWSQGFPANSQNSGDSDIHGIKLPK
jgi:hypothetical protein